MFEHYSFLPLTDIIGTYAMVGITVSSPALSCDVWPACLSQWSSGNHTIATGDSGQHDCVADFAFVADRAGPLKSSRAPQMGCVAEIEAQRCGMLSCISKMCSALRPRNVPQLC